MQAYNKASVQSVDGWSAAIAAHRFTAARNFGRGSLLLCTLPASGAQLQVRIHVYVCTDVMMGHVYGALLVAVLVVL